MVRSARRRDFLRERIWQGGNGVRSGRPDLAGSRQFEFRCRHTSRADKRTSGERSSRGPDVWLSAFFSRISHRTLTTNLPQATRLAKIKVRGHADSPRDGPRPSSAQHSMFEEIARMDG